MDTFHGRPTLRGVTRGEAKGHNSPGAEPPWRRQITAGDAEWVRGWGKTQKMSSQVLSSIQYICSLKTSVSSMGAPNLLLVPGAI